MGPVVAERQKGCRRGDSACTRSWAVVAALAKDTAEEERDSSCGGHGQGGDPIVSWVATDGVEAAVRVRGAGSRSGWVARPTA